MIATVIIYIIKQINIKLYYYMKRVTMKIYLM